MDSGAQADSARPRADALVELKPLAAALGPRYDLQRELGRGASSTVYLARDTTRGEDVAIKVLREELAGGVSTARFVREVAIGESLTHASILPIYDSGLASARPYYTMPYVHGQSLRERLRRERQLSLEDTISIARQIADALDYAHAHGVIHRDVKPGNILLASDGVKVADFGIARAMAIASGDHITDSGLALGTPEYMSPEQAEGSRDVDGRADVYGLGCVVYHMLAGEPPFTGPSSQAIIARHFQEAPRSLRVVRATIPRAVEAAIERALAKVPVDRFATAGEFVRALEVGARDTTPAAVPVAPGVRPRREWAVGGAMVALLAAVWFGTGPSAQRREIGRAAVLMELLGFGAPVLDTLTYVVVPFDEPGGGARSELSVRSHFTSALAHWSELRVPPPDQVDTAASVIASRFSPSERGKRLAERMTAAHYLEGQVTRARDSMTIVASLHATRTDSVLASARTTVAASGTRLDSVAHRLVDQLLVRGDRPVIDRAPDPRATRSLAARRAFLHALVLTERGDLLGADSSLSAASASDAGYAHAVVWQGVLRMWMNVSNLPWEQLAVRATAAAGPRALTRADSGILATLAAGAAGRWGDACPRWRALTIATPNDYAMWYGLGACLQRDLAVVRDPHDRRRFVFRASAEESVRAYERAFRLAPGLLRAFGGAALGDLQAIFLTSSTRMRTGRAVAPDTGTFRGFPEWRGDSLAQVVVPAAVAARTPFPSDAVRAVQRQRERMLAVTRMWRAESPASADAAEAVAQALELLGNPSAIDTLRLARTLNLEPSSALRLAAAEVFLGVKLSARYDHAALQRAVALADSLLAARAETNAAGHRHLAGLAALTGRATRAARHAAEIPMAQGSEPLARIGPALLAYAALGGPHDSVTMLAQRVDAAIGSLVEGAQRPARDQWARRAATLAFPELHLGALNEAERNGTRVINVVAAAVQRDAARVLEIVRATELSRATLRASDLTFDGLLPLAAALADVGHDSAAVSVIAPTLDALQYVSTGDLADHVRAGTLVRAFVLRARLAARAGDHESRRAWARAVTTLWAQADDFLLPVVRTMQQMSQ